MDVHVHDVQRMDMHDGYTTCEPLLRSKMYVEMT